MSAFNKFNVFTQDLGRKVHNLNSDNLFVMLSDVAPVNTNTVDGNITEISAGNGYTAGGNQASSNAYSQTSGVGKLTASNVVFTASGGAIAQFRYVVLYNKTAGSSSNRPLIGWLDCGSEVNLTNGNTFTVAWDGTNGILTVT